jgi:DNA invertase Pin-like site-specific DNA recombinase
MSKKTIELTEPVKDHRGVNRAARAERRAIDAIDKGDVLTVTRLDRLARSTRDLLNTLAAITGKGAGFQCRDTQWSQLAIGLRDMDRSLHDTLADTTTAHGRLMLTVLGGLAEFERELIRARTGEGRERAKANGVKMGRKPKLTPHQKKRSSAATARAKPCGR